MKILYLNQLLLHHYFILASKNKQKSSKLKTSQENNRTRSLDRSSSRSPNKSNTVKKVTYHTEVKPKTINPEWNEHFEL